MIRLNFLRVVALILSFTLMIGAFCLALYASEEPLLVAPNPGAAGTASGLQDQTKTGKNTGAEDSAPMGDPGFDPDCKSCVLMEASTGRILYAKNGEEALPPASVTKIMTLLLVMEAIDAGKLHWDDMITAGAHACSMGGSQIYLKENEQMTAEDMIKSVVIASANDAAVALAEHVMGSEEAFVKAMNRRAEELGMQNTHFENTNGLDDTAQNHRISAKDIAIMSRALISHKRILTYSSTWMDTVRDGAFGLTNTNRLVRFYKGCNGLKTGSTSKAGFCVSATADRDGMTLICVIMGAETRDKRNATAASLLDWGFATYGLYSDPGGTTDPVRIRGGVTDSLTGSYPAYTCVLEKAETERVQKVISLEEGLAAPIKKGEKIGTVSYMLGEQTLATTDILADESVEKIGYWGLLLQMLADFLLI